MENKVYDVVEGLIQKLKATQEENVEKTARLFADALKTAACCRHSVPDILKRGPASCASAPADSSRPSRLKNQPAAHMKESKVSARPL